MYGTNFGFFALTAFRQWLEIRTRNPGELSTTDPPSSGGISIYMQYEIDGYFCRGGES
jgi:hypothetical protein